MIPNVNVTIAQGQIGGVISTTDNVTGIICNCSGDGFAPYSKGFVTSEADAISKSITELTEPGLYRHIKEFYSVAAPGTKLYYMVVASNDTLVDMLTHTGGSAASTSALALLNFAQGTIRVLGAVNLSATLSGESTIDDDSINAITPAQAMADFQFYKLQPVRILIGAWRAAGTAGDFPPNAMSSKNVGIVLGGTNTLSPAEDDQGPSLGLVLGKVASVPVHRNIGRVKDGKLPQKAFYVGTTNTAGNTDMDTYVDNGFITFVTYPQVPGYYLSDDPMATASTDDENSLANGRVIDKATTIAYKTYIQELKDEIDVDSSGKLDSADVDKLKASITNAIKIAMSDNISSGPIIGIDESQNVLSTSQLNISLRIVPKGYLKEINVDLGFYNPSLTQ